MEESETPTILIVDDEKMNIFSLARILKGYAQLCFATTGEEALSLAASRHLDLILLDIMLPDISGFEVCQKLKSNRDTAQTPVVFITSLQKEEEEARGLRLGALDYIRKPFNPTIVQARVQNLLNLSLAYYKLERLSTTDFLTGAYNRRYFMESAEAEIKRQQRRGGSLTLLMLDIDHFKLVNDSYGHSFGDVALKHLVKVCHEQLREGDIFARMGGEEFAVVLPDIGPEGALEVAERLRSALLESPLAFNDNEVVLSMSLGLTCQPTGGGHELKELIDQADRALYHAKATGRNRVVSFSALER